jgi:hypothetical protein
MVYLIIAGVIATTWGIAIAVGTLVARDLRADHDLSRHQDWES